MSEKPGAVVIGVGALSACAVVVRVGDGAELGSAGRKGLLT